jgi:hypothetical protein
MQEITYIEEVDPRNRSTRVQGSVVVEWRVDSNRSIVTINGVCTNLDYEEAVQMVQMSKIA